MPYSVNLLVTEATCDSLLTKQGKHLNDLLFRQLSLQRQQASYTGNGAEVLAELAGVDTQVNGLRTMLAGLPEGDVKDANEARLKRLELRQYLLNQRQDDYGPEAMLEREFELASVAVEIAETQTVIAAVEARKAAL